MATILVTGGAGYIGSAAVKALIEKGFEVVVIDNLSHGNKRLVDKKAKFYKLDLAKHPLDEVFVNHNFSAVMHFAAYKSIEEGERNREKYKDNVFGTQNLLKAMINHGVKKIIYSSTAAVYGNHEGVVDEEVPAEPVNYYGKTKLESEEMLIESMTSFGLDCIILRYFNVAGDAGLNYVDSGAKNIFPVLMDVIFGRKKEMNIFGTDYETRDGTCVRDYIDINDLVEAHILALDANYKGVINLGTSNGVTVKELITFTEKVVGKKIKVVNSPRRKGDVAVSIASNKRAKKVLGWQPKKDVKEMIKSTFEAYKNSQ
ncbi:MAG: UDP-glucose 4-epimerase GalE [archaeon]